MLFDTSFSLLLQHTSYSKTHVTIFLLLVNDFLTMTDSMRLSIVHYPMPNVEHPFQGFISYFCFFCSIHFISFHYSFVLLELLLPTQEQNSFGTHLHFDLHDPGAFTTYYFSASAPSYVSFFHITIIFLILISYLSFLEFSSSSRIFYNVLLWFFLFLHLLTLNFMCNFLCYFCHLPTGAASTYFRHPLTLSEDNWSCYNLLVAPSYISSSISISHNVWHPLMVIPGAATTY